MAQNDLHDGPNRPTLMFNNISTRRRQVDEEKRSLEASWCQTFTCPLRVLNHQSLSSPRYLRDALLLLERVVRQSVSSRDIHSSRTCCSFSLRVLCFQNRRFEKSLSESSDDERDLTCVGIQSEKFKRILSTESYSEIVYRKYEKEKNKKKKEKREKTSKDEIKSPLSLGRREETLSSYYSDPRKYEEGVREKKKSNLLKEKKEKMTVKAYPTVIMLKTICISRKLPYLYLYREILNDKKNMKLKEKERKQTGVVCRSLKRQTISQLA